MKTAQQLHNFSQNIRYLRKKYRFTQAEMASMLGITLAAMQKTETETYRRAPGLDVLINTSICFGISATRLLTTLLEDN